MKPDKAHNDNIVSTSKKGVNPFIKLANDKECIADAVKNGQPLSSLTDIKFVRPIHWSEDEEFVAELDERVRRYKEGLDVGYTWAELETSIEELKKERENFLDEYNKELEESEGQIDAGDCFTQDEVKKILVDRRKRINGD